MKYLVRLTDQQLTEAAEAGFRRHLDVVLKDRHDDYRVKSRATKDGWEDHIEGATAEMGVCVAFGLPFSGYQPTGITRLRDAGPLEVRYVKHKGYALVTYPKDLPHQKLVLCRVHHRQVLLEGWATSQEIRQWGTPIMDKWPGLFPDELHSMSTVGYSIANRSQVKELAAAS